MTITKVVEFTADEVADYEDMKKRFVDAGYVVTETRSGCCIASLNEIIVLEGKQ